MNLLFNDLKILTKSYSMRVKNYILNRSMRRILWLQLQMTPVNQRITSQASVCSCEGKEGLMKATDNLIAHKAESHNGEQTYIPLVPTSEFVIVGNLPKCFEGCPFVLG